MSKINFDWKAVAIILITINLLFFGWLLLGYGSPYFGGSLLMATPNLVVLSIVDLIAVFFYIKKQHANNRPQGMAKRVITDAALIVIGLVLIISVVIVYIFRSWLVHLIWRG